MTHIDQQALASLRSEPLPAGTKGLPLGNGRAWTIDSIAAAGWNVLAGDLLFPVMTLRRSALSHNIATMSAYCQDREVLLAPHGKTSMAPQLFAEQIAAGCWAITAATPTHLSLYRAFGVQRIVYANQLVEPASLRWLASELNRDERFDFYSLVDSVEGVTRMASILDREQLRQPVDVLIEIGHLGGRTGCRTVDDVSAVADAVLRSRSLRLAGIETFEGTLDNIVTAAGTGEERAAPNLSAHLDRVAASVRALTKTSHLDTEREIIVSGGGSAFFDRVIDALAPLRDDLPSLRLVLRSGSYITHDGGYYARTSPLGQRARSSSGSFEAALELWSVVLSRPEPDLAILGAGKRDLPIDMGFPTPTRRWNERQGMQALPAERVTVTGVSDQHIHLRIDPDLSLEVGDLCAWTVSHPCTAFDKWRLIPIVDDELTIVDAIRTFF